jgi:2-iminobutanoate/2-iminopropanoate deaminase
MLMSIQSKKANPPGGHYSQGMVTGGLVFVSGQLGFRLGTEDRTLGTIAEQTRNCLENISLILEEVGSDMDKVVKTTVYVADMSAWEAVNQVYEDVFGDHRPARAIVPCGPLHFDGAVEIDAIAAV